MSFYDRQFLGLNPRDFGAKGNGVDDDTVAFQACQAEAIASGINAISFDDGIYPIGDRGPPAIPQSGNAYLLGDIGVDGFLFEGTGPGSVLLIHPNQVGTPSFAVVGLRAVTNPVSKRVTLRNFRIDGNKDNLSGITSQSISGISIISGEDILIENVIVHDIPSNSEVRGIGFSLGANTDTEFVSRLTVRNCIAYSNGGSGFQVLNTQDFFTLENSIAYDHPAGGIYLRNLSNTNPARSIIVRNCTAVIGPSSAGGGFDRYALIFDSSTTAFGEDTQIESCSILGRVLLREADRVFIDDCIVHGDEGNQVRLEERTNLVSITNSILSTTANGPAVSMSGSNTFDTKQRWSLRNNIILSVLQSIAGDRKTGEDGEIDGNTFIATGTSTAAHITLDSTQFLAAIVGVNTGSPYFEIAGDLRNNLIKGSGSLPDYEISVFGSSFNDGTYTVNGNPTLVSGNTRIVTNEPIPDATVDGNMFLNALTSVRIRRNTFVGDISEIVLSARDVNSWRSIVVMENYFGGTKNDFPISFPQNVGANFASYPALINNILGPNKVRVVVAAQLATLLRGLYVAGWNYETDTPNEPRNAIRHLVRDGSPNGVVFGWIGEEATDISGGAGAIHYVKDSGNLTSFGWVGK